MDERERLVSIICTAKEMNDTLVIEDNCDLIDDLEFDSVEMVKLIIMIEDEFGFEFDDSNLGTETLSSFNTLLEIVKENGNEE